MYLSVVVSELFFSKNVMVIVVRDVAFVSDLEEFVKGRFSIGQVEAFDDFSGKVFWMKTELLMMNS